VDLPFADKIVIGMSNLWQHLRLLIVVGIVAGIFGLKIWYGTPQGRYFLDSVILKLPVLGILMRKIAVARFTRTLGTLISSGVPIWKDWISQRGHRAMRWWKKRLFQVRRSLEKANR